MHFELSTQSPFKRINGWMHGSDVCEIIPKIISKAQEYNNNNNKPINKLYSSNISALFIFCTFLVVRSIAFSILCFFFSFSSPALCVILLFFGMGKCDVLLFSCQSLLHVHPSQRIARIISVHHQYHRHQQHDLCIDWEWCQKVPNWRVSWAKSRERMEGCKNDSMPLSTGLRDNKQKSSLSAIE